MNQFIHTIAAGLFHLGGFGMLIMGIADSSFLTMPLANDVLVIAQSATHHDRVLYYALMATAGSTLGCAIVDVVSRKAEAGLEKQIVQQKRLKFIETQMRKRAGWATAIAAIVPPPFPFTPVIAAAAGVGYPRKKLFTIIVGVRFIRFGVEGFFAVLYGKRILQLADSPKLEYSVIALAIIGIAGSAVSIFRWIRKGRSAQQGRKSRP